MKILTLGVLLLASLLAGNASAQETTMKELAPTGKLRVGIVFAPVMSTFFVIKDETGKPKGVTVDIGEALGKKLNLPVEFVLYPNSGQVTDAVKSGAVDVGFMPVDEQRQEASRHRARLRARREHLHGHRRLRREERRGCRQGRHAGDRHRQHHDHPRRRAHAEEHHHLSRDLGRRRDRGDEGGQGGRVCARPRLAAAPT
jgi:hypothetical protein